MIEKLIISESSFIYIRLKALIWNSNGLTAHSTLYFTAVEALKEIYEKIDTRKPLIVSCKGVVDGGDRGLENFFADIVKNSERPIIFIHTESLLDLLLNTIHQVGAKAPNYEQIPEKNIFKVNCKESIVALNEINSEIEKVEKRFIHDTIKSCYKADKSGQVRLLSTVVKAKGEFDAGKIISEPHLFIWICLFLAETLDNYIKKEIEEKERNPNAPEIKLLAVSLRGSPFAAAISLLINKSYDTIDHLGPRHKLFDVELLDNFKKGVRYIYVGDFIVGGTEVKIAKAYAELLGCEMNYAVVLSSLLDPDVFKDNFNLIALTRIKEVVPEADYQLLDKV
jgi:hypothetical protein